MKIKIRLPSLPPGVLVVLQLPAGRIRLGKEDRGPRLAREPVLKEYLK